MKILFAEIPEGGLTIEVADQSWFPESDFNKKSTACARVVFVRKASMRVMAKGNLSVDLGFSCDRCLEEYTYPLSSDFLFDFELLGKGEPDFQEREHSCSETEMDVVYTDEAKIDVFAMLAQQVFVAVPKKRLCEDFCKGLCPECGVNLNMSPCVCAEDTSKSPFAALAKLKI